MTTPYTMAAFFLSMSVVSSVTPAQPTYMPNPSTHYESTGFDQWTNTDNERDNSTSDSSTDQNNLFNSENNSADISHTHPNEVTTIQPSNWNQTLNETNTANATKMTDMLEYKIYYFFIRYFIYIASLPGLVTNPLIVALSLRVKPFGTTELYMLVLGTTDLVLIILRLTIRSLETYYIIWSDFLCKLLFSLVDTLYVYSNWIVVCWTLERLIAVMFPLKLASWCTIWRTKTGLASVCFISIFLNIPSITERHGASIAHTSYCWATKHYFTVYSPIINAFYMYIPMTVVFLSNIVIVKKIKMIAMARVAVSSNKETVEKRQHEQRQLTRLLLVVAYTFVFLHLPQVLANLWEIVYPDPMVIYQNSIRDFIRYHMFVTIGYQISDIQNSINFFLYCFFGSKIRKALFNMCGCCRKREQASMSVTRMTSVSATCN